MKSVFRSIAVMIWIFVILIAYSECIEKYSAKGKNLCTRVDWFEKNVTVPRTEQVQVPRNRFCASFPFICSYDEWTTKIVEEVVKVNLSRTIKECCKGYDNIHGSCVPICHTDCGHGECAAPDLCFCDEGWAPPLCTQECDVNHYGIGCAFKCRCENGASCDKKDGSCHCAPGYIGDYCQETCPVNVYGENCALECKCQNNATCSSIDGSCECDPGYIGQYCEDMCNEGNHGKNCEDKCVCVNETTETCNHVTGECICKPGSTGVNCEHICEHFTYGKNCSSKCACDTLHTSGCAPVDGFCFCEPGWKGENCSTPCPVGKFGEFCEFECTPCPTPSATCNPETGFCDCPPGSFGDMCHMSCPDGWWGVNCTTKCNCTDNEVCNLVTGKCISVNPLKSNFTEDGPDCHDSFWLTNCTKCKCRDNEQCLPFTGWCLPLIAVTPSGINLTESPLVCPDGFWGSNCSKICQCRQSENVVRTTCNRKTGHDCIRSLRLGKMSQNETKTTKVVWTPLENHGNITDIPPKWHHVIVYGEHGKNYSQVNPGIEKLEKHTESDLEEIGQFRRNHDQVIPGIERLEKHTESNLDEIGQFRRNHDQAVLEVEKEDNVTAFISGVNKKENGPIQVVLEIEKEVNATAFTSRVNKEENGSIQEVADCGPNYYGPGCKYKCNCAKDEICDRHTGACTLKLHENDSFEIADCGPYYYGPDCRYLCNCAEEEICERHTGACLLKLHNNVSFDDMSRENKIAVLILLPILCLALLAGLIFALYQKGCLSVPNRIRRRRSRRNITTPSASTDYIVDETMNNPMYGVHDDVVIPLDGPQFARGPSVRYSKNTTLQAGFFNEVDGQESRSSVTIPADPQRSSALRNSKTMRPKQETKVPAQETNDSTAVPIKEDTQRLSVLNNFKTMWLKENGKMDSHGPAKVAPDSTSDKFEDDFIASAMESLYDENHYDIVPSAKEKIGAADTDKKAN